MDKEKAVNETEVKSPRNARKVGGLWLDPIRFPHLIKNSMIPFDKEEKPS